MRQETKEAIRPFADAFAKLFPDASANQLIVWGQSRDTRIHRRALLLSNFLLRGKPRTIVAPLPGGASVSGNSGDLVLRYMYVFGVWEPIVSSQLKTSLWPGSVFVDVGANRGYYSALAADALGSGGTVLAIEASPAIAASLRATAASLKSSCAIRVVECALSDRVGISDFHLPVAGNEGVGSLVNQSDAAGGSISVDTMTLDGLLSSERVDPARISVVKIDVEGAEVLVLNGASSALQRMPLGSKVFVEIASMDELQEVRNLLEVAGFEPQRLANEYTPRWYAENRRNPNALIGSDAPRYPQDFVFTKSHSC